MPPKNKQAPPQPQKPAPKKQRISIFTAIFMMIMALIIDCLQFVVTFAHVIPVVGNAFAIIFTWYLGAVAAIAFTIWFALLGVNYFGKNSAKKLGIIFGTSIIEIVPILNGVPGVTFGVGALIAQTMMEDKNIKIGLLDIASTAAMFVPGGQAVAGLRAAQVAARSAEAVKAGEAAAAATKATRTAKSATTAAPDFGPGIKPQQKFSDINTPFRKAESAANDNFAEPYVPANEDAQEEGKWVA